MLTNFRLFFKDDQGNEYKYKNGTYLKKNGRLVRIDRTIPELFEIKKLITEQLEKIVSLRDSNDLPQYIEDLDELFGKDLEDESVS